MKVIKSGRNCFTFANAKNEEEAIKAVEKHHSDKRIVSVEKTDRKVN